MVKKENNKIVILHIFDDEKFFDSVSCFFDSLSNVSNLYYFYTPQKDYKFQRIKLINKITLINDFKTYCNFLSNKDIDIIYFHSLYVDKYKYFKFISSEKIVIWWCFGAEIYYSHKGLKPLIDIELYKPLTLKHKNKYTPVKYKIKEFIKSLFSSYSKKIQNKVISRIDYFSPVLPIEYELMKRLPLFKAKPFMLNVGPGNHKPIPLPIINKPKNILIGNSLTYTNNHLDIFNILNKVKIDSSRKYIIPINYGNDFINTKQKLKDSLHTSNTIWLENFIPLNEYTTYLDSITHAIFGHVRQQAIGNLNFCFERGIKVFLYTNSIMYKQYKEMGYIIFSIENDLNSDSLSKILSREEAKINYNLFCNRIKNRKYNTEIELKNIIKK